MGLPIEESCLPIPCMYKRKMQVLIEAERLPFQHYFHEPMFKSVILWLNMLQ